MNFTLAENELPFNFFDEVGFSYYNIIIDCIKRKFTLLTESECDTFFENHEDDFTELLYELRDSDPISGNQIGESEVDESTGTFGYFDYEISDVKNVRLELENEVRLLVKGLLTELELKRVNVRYYIV